MTGPAIITPDDDAYRAWLATQQPKPPKGPNITTHDDAEYQAWLAKNGQQQSSSASPRSTLYNTLSTASDALIPFGLGRDIRAAYNAAGDAIRGRDGFVHSFTANKDADIAGQEQLAAQHPYGSAVINGLGTGAQIVATAGLGAAKYLNPETENTALTTAGRIYNSGKQAAKTGAAVGAVQSLGNAPNRGGIGDQIATAAKGAAAGGAIGGLFGAGAAAFPVAADAASTAGSKVRQVATDFANRVASRDDASAPIAGRVTPIAAAEAGAGAATPPSQPPKVDRASVLLIQRLVRAGMNPQQAIDALGQIPASKPVSLMEIAGDKSQPVRELGKWVARTPSTGAADLRSAVAQRTEPLPNAQRVLGDVADAMGVNRTNLVENEQQLVARQRAAAKPFYDASVDNPNVPPVPFEAKSDDGVTLGKLLETPALRNARKQFNTNAANRGEPSLDLPTGKPTAAPALPPTPPGFSPEQWADAVQMMQKRGIPVPGMSGQTAQADATGGVSLKALQKLKFQLDDDLNFAENNGRFPDGTAATIDNMDGVNRVRVRLLNIMTNHAPELGKGNEVFGGDAAIQQAGKRGQKFLQPNQFSTVQTEYPALTPSEQENYKTNALSGPIRDRLYTGQAVDRQKTLTSPDMQERLGLVVPPDKMAQLKQNLGVEHEIALTNQQIPNGSDTYANLQNDADVSHDVQGVQNAKNLLLSIISGRPKAALRATFNNVLQPRIDQYIHGMNEQAANALAPKLAAGMLSRQELVNVLEDLATKHDALRRMSINSSPLVGSAVGAGAGLLPQGNR